MATQTTVLKFGSSVLKCEDDIPKAVHEIYRHWRQGSQVLVVVSAFQGATDALIKKSKEYGDDVDVSAAATLIATGETVSASLLALALKRSGIPSKLLNPDQVGLRTAGDPLDSEPILTDVERLKRELNDAIVIVSGFVGMNDDGDLTLLGRGGSDLTALFLAQKLDAKCVLVKDIDGLYESDPSDARLRPNRFTLASYETTIRLGDQLVQPKAVRFAEGHNQSFEIAAIGSTNKSTVGNFADNVGCDAHEHRPLRVALLGCGTVGGGVYQRLAVLPEFFEIVGVVNLDPNKAFAVGIQNRHLERDAKYLIEKDCDVVIELIGGREPARTFIEHALRSGRNVVTANKALLAESGEELQTLATENRVTIRYSASVGGALPALEAVTPNGTRPRAFKGIINGTCNFVIDQLASGADFKTAVTLAQKAGFAEADPTLDLDGTDAAQKLSLLARQSFGEDLPISEIVREGIDRLTTEDVLEANERGNVFRLIAECSSTEDGIKGSIKPIELPATHPFALVKGAENCLEIETESGQIKTIKGCGAGRHATTESILADLFDLRREFVLPKPGKFKEVHA